MSHTLLPYGFVKRCVLCGGGSVPGQPFPGVFPPPGMQCGVVDVGLCWCLIPCRCRRALPVSNSLFSLLPPPSAMIECQEMIPEKSSR